MWIKLINGGRQLWVNTAQVRRFEAAYGANTKAVFNLKDHVTIDQSLDEVMIAMGYEPPPKPPVETHAAAGEASTATFPSKASYRELAEKALTESGKPMTVAALVHYIGAHRVVNADSVRTAVGSYFKKVDWNGSPAWWFKDRALPEES